MSRATWFSRGLTLPRRGSPGDMVLREMLYREQALRAAEVTLMARLAGLTAGVEKKHLDKALTAYLDELTHQRYTPAPPANSRSGKPSEAELLSRVAGLSSSAK